MDKFNQFRSGFQCHFTVIRASYSILNNYNMKITKTHILVTFLRHKCFQAFYVNFILICPISHISHVRLASSVRTKLTPTSGITLSFFTNLICKVDILGEDSMRFSNRNRHSLSHITGCRDQNYYLFLDGSLNFNQKPRLII